MHGLFGLPLPRPTRVKMVVITTIPFKILDVFVIAFLCTSRYFFLFLPPPPAHLTSSGMMGLCVANKLVAQGYNRVCKRESIDLPHGV